MLRIKRPLISVIPLCATNGALYHIQQGNVKIPLVLQIVAAGERYYCPVYMLEPFPWQATNVNSRTCIYMRAPTHAHSACLLVNCTLPTAGNSKLSLNPVRNLE